MYVFTFGWMDVWVGGWMDGWMDGWMGGWMDGWMDGWRMDRWMNRQTYRWNDNTVYVGSTYDLGPTLSPFFTFLICSEL